MLWRLLPAMAESIAIDPRFCGPPDSAHGGYACGRVAEFVSGAAEVTLRRPPPLGRSLQIEWRDGSAALLDGETVVAEGTPCALELGLPEPVADMEPDEAFASFTLFDNHWLRTYFGCGPDRDLGDGLRLFPRRVPERALLAVPWTPDPSLNGGEGWVRPEFVWAALDCPSGFGAGIAPDKIAFRQTRAEVPCASARGANATSFWAGCWAATGARSTELPPSSRKVARYAPTPGQGGCCYGEPTDGPPRLHRAQTNRFPLGGGHRPAECHQPGRRRARSRRAGADEPAGDQPL